MASNGNLPASSLSPIGGGFYLVTPAARAFNAMAAEATKRWGHPIRVISSYRTYAKQVYFWNLYRSGRGNLAAIPGSSNHGWGLAIDLASQWDRWAVDQIGSKYGWAKRCSDAQSEWWHIKYSPACTGASYTPTNAPSGPRVLRQGMRGKDVKDLQVWLIRGGFLAKGAKGQSPVIDGNFGVKTTRAVQAFQRANKLRTDGIAGPSTIAALKRKYSWAVWHAAHK